MRTLIFVLGYTLLYFAASTVRTIFDMNLITIEFPNIVKGIICVFLALDILAIFKKR